MARKMTKIGTKKVLKNGQNRLDKRKKFKNRQDKKILKVAFQKNLKRQKFFFKN